MPGGGAQKRKMGLLPAGIRVYRQLLRIIVALWVVFLVLCFAVGVSRRESGTRRSTTKTPNRNRVKLNKMFREKEVLEVVKNTL